RCPSGDLRLQFGRSRAAHHACPAPPLFAPAQTIVGAPDNIPALKGEIGKPEQRVTKAFSTYRNELVETISETSPAVAIIARDPDMASLRFIAGRQPPLPRRTGACLEQMEMPDRVVGAHHLPAASPVTAAEYAAGKPLLSEWMFDVIGIFRVHDR